MPSSQTFRPPSADLSLAMKAVSRTFERIELSKGLDHLGNDYDLLARLYERLQLSAVEPSDLDMDLLTFATKACDFAVITKTVHLKVAKVGQNKMEKEMTSMLTSKTIVGFVYLASSKNDKGLSANSQLSMGIIIDSEHHKKGYAKRAIRLALKRAFKSFHCHRVQAIIVNPFGPEIYPAYKAFVAAGFKQEGVWRRAHYNHFSSKWEDVAYLAVLDTEWSINRIGRNGKETITTWDEMFSRHQRESEELDSVSGQKQYIARQVRGAMADWQNGVQSGDSE